MGNNLLGNYALGNYTLVNYVLFSRPQALTFSKTFICLIVASLSTPALASATQEVASQVLPTVPALITLTLALNMIIQLWMHPEANQRPYRDRALLYFALSVGACLIWSCLTTVPTPLSLLGYGVIQVAGQIAINRQVRLASFEELRGLLLHEVAQKTTSLEEKNRQLKSAKNALNQANRELKNLSFTDSLTGTFNRLYFDRQFLTAWQRARREQEPLSLILVDLDHFKELNDRHGHLFGDRALKFAARGLKEGFQRSSDTVCRYGGEEFVVLLPNTLPEQALTMAEKVRQTLEGRTLQHEGQVIQITASFGVGGVVPLPHDEPLGLLHAVDQALYQVKRNGRNDCRLATFKRYSSISKMV